MHSVLHIIFEADFGPIPGFWLLVLADVLAWTSVPSVLIKRSGRPVSALSWMLGLLFLPYIGFIFWWLIGVERLERRRRKRRSSTEEFEESIEDTPSEEVEQTVPPALSAFSPILPGGLFRSHGPLRMSLPTDENNIDLLVDGQEGFGAMRQMIEQADHYVHLLFYIWQFDETGSWLADLLVEKAEEGVEVRVLVDPYGSPKFRGNYAERIEQAGGKVGYFLPPRFFAWRPTFNFRNHRKLIVCDGRDAWTGGMNVGVEYEKLWHDLGMRVYGPAVRRFHEVFLDDWYFATGENLAHEEYLSMRSRDATETTLDETDATNASCAVLASGPDHERSVMHDAFYHAISEAEQRLWIITPYFIPGADILKALEAAVHRDVDVRLLLPLDGDVPFVRYASRSYYSMLLSQGVRIWEYQPRVMHAKGMIVDDRFSFVGSANVDVRSFEINFEIGAFVASRQLTQRLEEMFHRDFEVSEEILLDDMEKIGPWARFRNAIAHLASPML